MEQRIEKIEEFLSQLTNFLRNINIPEPKLVIGTLLYLRRKSETEPFIKRGAPPKINSFYTEVISEYQLKSINISLKESFDVDITNKITDLILRVPGGSISAINRFLGNFNFSKEGFSDKEFGMLFNRFLFLMNTWNRGNEYCTPDDLAKFINRFITLNNEDTVLDPFCGTGNLITTIARSQKVNCEFILNDVNEDTAYLGKLNFLSNGIENFEYFRSDAFRQTSPIQNAIYDWIISDPPMGSHSNLDNIDYHFNTQFKKSNRFENLSIQLLLDLLSSKGKAFIIVPEGFCTSFSPSSFEIRKYLVDEDYLDSVISLPSGLYKPYTNIKTSLLIIDKSKDNSRKGNISFWEFDDVQKFQKMNDVSFKEIFNQTDNIDYGIRIQVVLNKTVQNQKYQINANRFIRSSPDIQFLDGKRLRTLLNFYNCGRTITKSKLSYDSGIPYITIKDLSKSEADLTLNTDNIEVFVPKSEYNKFSQSYKEVKNRSILIAKIGQNLKPTMITSGNRIIISNNILMLTLNESIILPEYLISQLRESYVMEQVNAIRKGSAQTYFTINEFLNIVIKVPSLDKQHEIVNTFYSQLLTSNKELIRFKESEKLEDLIKILSTLKHEFSNRKRRFESEIENLESFLNLKISAKSIINWDDQLTSSSRSLKSIFTNTQEAFNSLTDLIEDIPKIIHLDKDGLNKQPTQIKSFILSLLIKFQPTLDSHNIHFQLREVKDLKVNLDTKKFSFIIDNFIENSIKHAFEKENANKLIEIEIRLSDDKQFVEIDLKDNGKGLDQGFTIDDYIKLWAKSGDKGGTGLGGHLIYLVVKYHGGQMSFIEDPRIKGQFNFYLRISLPYS